MTRRWHLLVLVAPRCSLRLRLRLHVPRVELLVLVEGLLHQFRVRVAEAGKRSGDDIVLEIAPLGAVSGRAHPRSVPRSHSAGHALLPSAVGVAALPDVVYLMARCPEDSRIVRVPVDRTRGVERRSALLVRRRLHVTVGLLPRHRRHRTARKSSVPSERKVVGLLVTPLAPGKLSAQRVRNAHESCSRRYASLPQVHVENVR